MDYSQVPLHKRTRHQFDLFYKRYHEERQKAKSGGSSGAACGVGGGAELSGSVSGGREERGSEVNLAKKGENAGDIESREGFKRAKNRAEIGVGSDRDGNKSKEGVLVKKGIRELQKGLKSTNNGIRIEIDAKLKNVGGNSKRGLKSKVSMDVGSKGIKRESSGDEGVTGNAKKRPKRTKSRGEIGGNSNRDRKKLPEEFKSRDTGEKAVIKKSETGSQGNTSRVEKDVDSKKLRGNSKRGLKGTNAIEIDTSDDENGDDEVEILDVIYNSSNRGWPKAKGKDSDYMDAKEAVSSDQKIGGGEGVMSDRGKESGVAGQTQLDSGSLKESQTDSEDSIDVGAGINSDQKMESGIVGQTQSDSESQSVSEDSEERESSSDNEGLPGNVEKGSKSSKSRGEIGGNLKRMSKVGLRSKDTGKGEVIKKPEKGLKRTNSRGGMEVDTNKVRGNSKRELKGTNVNRIDSNSDDGSDDEVKYEGVIYSRSNRGWPKAKGKDSDYMDTKEVVSSDQKIGGGDVVKSDQGKESGVVGQTRLNFGASKESQADSENSIGVGDGVKSDQKKESGVVNQTPSDSESQNESEELESSSEEDKDDENDKDFVGDDSGGCYSSSSSEDRNDEDENEDEDEEKEQEKDEDDEVLLLLEEDLEDEKDDECRIVEIESVVGKGKKKSIEVGLKRKYKPRQVKDVEGLSSIGVAEERKDELESSIMKGGSIDEVEKDRSIEGGLKRRKFSGLDILVDSSKVKSEETKSVANRLRSRSVPKSKRRKLNLGTISRPFTVDDLDSTSGNDEDTDENDMKDTEPASKSGQKGRGKLVKRPVGNHIRGPTDCDLVIEDELDPFSGSDDVGDENDAKVLPRTSAEVEGISSKPTERRHIDAVGNKALDHSKGNRDDSDEKVGKDALTIGRKGNGKFEKPTGGRHIHTRKGFDPLKILTDSIWEKVSSLLEDTVPPSPVEEVPAETTLVYKFRFEDEVPKPPEKSYWDQQSDVLFEEMAMALRSSEIGSSSSAMRVLASREISPSLKPDNNLAIFWPIEDDSFPTRTEASPAILCQRGIHEYILDDQIGLICRICSFVEVEIKHILPSFCKNPRGRSGNQYYGKDGCSFFTELQSQDPVSENPDGRVCTKGTVWDLVPGIKDLYPHQCEGFEFMWKNVAGGIYIDKLEKPLSGAGGGCIISHAPGTGKTLMTIVFLQSFLNLYPESKPL
ncbi:hypothetical protein RJ639_022732 [Escallonia herrerae]|uniref:Uncharacterized protein n=1 Tax=Escallonia herrerae TaxID=1293975 RepID=A0AA88UZQ4_9ASTE|nr:hypothetical protein RJ639_022732 [Escallonia herrerae]